MKKKKVYIYYHQQKEVAKEIYKESLAYFQQKEIEVLGKEREEEADFYLVIGGDGTLLKAFQDFQRLDIPVIAVNAGSLGFLTEIKREDSFLEIENFLQGDFSVQERQYFKVKIAGKSYRALNEVVISRKNIIQNMVQVSLHTEGHVINTFKGDGLIVATPTGSTAYSLSAGGPIVEAGLKLYIVTPIAPHNLNTRPIILQGEMPLALTLEREEQAYCLIDGVNIKEIAAGEKIELAYEEKSLQLVVPKHRDYYSILREKLKWGDKLC